MNENIAWTFKGGKRPIRKDTVAGNVDTTVTVPAGKRWQLLGVTITVTTDVTVANRIMYVTIRDVVDAIKFLNNASISTASATDIMKYFMPCFFDTNNVFNALGEQTMDAGEDIFIEMTNGVAGDSYDYLLEYLEIDV